MTCVLIFVGCGGKTDPFSGLIGIRGKLRDVAPALRVCLAIVKSVLGQPIHPPTQALQISGLYHSMTVVAVTKWEGKFNCLVQEELL